MQPVPNPKFACCMSVRGRRFARQLRCGRPMLDIGCADACVCVGSVLAKWNIYNPTLPRKVSIAVL